MRAPEPRRRAFLLGAVGAVLGTAGAAASAAQQGGALGGVRDPSVLGQARQPTDPRSNEGRVKAVELRLACSCGCTLDVFTCRTTDFTCTTSPAMHREVLALFEQGKSEQEILDAFVAKHGEKVLMAPKPEGFNLAGYVVPGIAITTVGGLLAWVIARRRTLAPAAGTPALAPDGADAVEVPSSRHSPEELERLRRALTEVED